MTQLSISRLKLGLLDFHVVFDGSSLTIIWGEPRFQPVSFLHRKDLMALVTGANRRMGLAIVRGKTGGVFADRQEIS